MSSAIHSDPFDPHERLGDIKVTSDLAVRPPVGAQPDREHVMTIRVYDYCEKYGAHTDPELQVQEEGL